VCEAARKNGVPQPTISGWRRGRGGNNGAGAANSLSSSSGAAAHTAKRVCERALKMDICHWRNSLFYRTQHGATVGDMFVPDPYHGAAFQEPFDYLTRASCLSCRPTAFQQAALLMPCSSTLTGSTQQDR
jgi:hypothetical protein